jgi:hypothetical protein
VTHAQGRPQAGVGKAQIVVEVDWVITGCSVGGGLGEGGVTGCGRW